MHPLPPELASTAVVVVVELVEEVVGVASPCSAVLLVLLVLLALLVLLVLLVPLAIGLLVEAAALASPADSPCWLVGRAGDDSLLVRPELILAAVTDVCM